MHPELLDPNDTKVSVVEKESKKHHMNNDQNTGYFVYTRGHTTP